jgi:hypothetical protein
MKEILANYDERGLVVYQAFEPGIVDAALEKGSFGKGFGLERMTWIKPSFGWMLHRSSYATAHRQERILRITLSHESFRSILEKAVLTSYKAGGVHASEDEWRIALKRSPVRCQWDPDRNPVGRPLDRRAIQLGLSGPIVHDYVERFIIGLEDVTPLAHAILQAKREGTPLPEVPLERVYAVSDEIRHRLGMS